MLEHPEHFPFDFSLIFKDGGYFRRTRHPYLWVAH
ncbi:hypothetical protein LLO_0714 [Legionella longbeachae NSW150]|uniref:Uncharacterized protein n=1 Tax=Legionella longbeachae serogroup 1 (strain NSW150) TaxID=661367 RepID=D3HQ86_LEGLN|nr:hypothetical protein LLO_0714 [Legionella longbeachae NSW150]